MGRQAKDLKFKPYVGGFFQFTEQIKNQPTKASVGRKLYGNQVKDKIKYTSFEELPASILVVDEKRNHVKFLSPNNQYFWTTKTSIEPLEIPAYSESPMPVLQEYKKFLVYCTDTKIAEFQIEKMTKMAINLLPKLDAMIKTNQVDFLGPMNKK